MERMADGEVPLERERHDRQHRRIRSAGKIPILVIIKGNEHTEEQSPLSVRGNLQLRDVGSHLAEDLTLEVRVLVPELDELRRQTWKVDMQYFH